MTARTSSSAETLYAHIRRLLDEHVFVHLTSYYVDCTQRRVYEALTGGLLPVSVDDPHSLVLPSDPLDDFIREHCQVELKDMHGKLTVVKEAKELINSSCTVKARPVEGTFTSRFSHTHCGYIPSTDLFADPSVLTVRTVQYTPKLGCSKISRSVPVNLREVINQNSMELPLDEEDECINAQTMDIFDTRLVVDDHVWKKIQPLNQECAFSTAATNETASALCNKFKLLRRTPSPPILVPLPDTPPLFSRMSVVPKRLAHTLASMSDIPLLTPFTSEVGDEGKAEYEIVNDAWDISSALSPPPSLSHGASEQDETFIPSSESRGHTYELLTEKMDTFHMPRQSRIGGSSGTLKVAGQGQLFPEYISRVIDTTREPIVTTISSSASPTVATLLTSAGRAFPTPNNMCQMSDDLEDTILGPLTLDFSDDVIDTVLSNGSTDMRSGLMEVPRLPAPNVHTDSIVWPNDMSSLVANEAFSSFYVVNGVKSLNIELTWRPYNSEQEIPALEELVGVSEPHLLAITCIDGEETRDLLGRLLKSLDTLVHDISIEEEDQRKLQAYLKSPPNLDFVTDHLNPLDCRFSNVLLTRVERHQSRMMSGSHLETETDHALRWDGASRDIQSQGSERPKADDPSESEGDYNVGSIDFVQWDLVDLPARERTPVSDPIEDVSLDAESDVISAPHVQSPKDSIVLVSPAGLSQSAVSIRSMAASDYSIPDWIHPSKFGGVDDLDKRSLTPSAPAMCEEQSLHGYLNVLAKQPSLSRADNDMRLTSPAGSEPQVLPATFFDAEGLARELINLTGPLPADISFLRNHRYLASVELLQDRALMRALRSDSLRIELLEREWLDGADIVFDCDTALVFAPLIQNLLASSFLSLKNKLISLSWRYTHLAVVFKLYDTFFSGLQRPRDEEEQGILITQVIKSIKKLHRDLAIADAYATKRPQTVVQMYFVRSVELAARTTRLLGDMAESQSQLGPWGDRQWLEVDEKEDERYLAGVDGMNAFSAAAILSKISLHDFLALRPDQRLELALPIPEGMMERFNEVIAQRRDDVDMFVDDSGVLSS